MSCGFVTSRLDLAKGAPIPRCSWSCVLVLRVSVWGCASGAGGGGGFVPPVLAVPCVACWCAAVRVLVAAPMAAGPWCSGVGVAGWRAVPLPGAWGPGARSSGRWALGSCRAVSRCRCRLASVSRGGVLSPPLPCCGAVLGWGRVLRAWLRGWGCWSWVSGWPFAPVGQDQVAILASLLCCLSPPLVFPSPLPACSAPPVFPVSLRPSAPCPSPPSARPLCSLSLRASRLSNSDR